MINFRLPFIKLPSEFISLLKMNLVLGDSPAPVFDLIRQSPALYAILQKAFSEFDDGRGVEKLLLTLTWPNFRDRMASLYIFKTMYGKYPERTSLELIEDIRLLENRFMDHSVNSSSRAFMLGFYLKLANLQKKNMENFTEIISISSEVEQLIHLSPVKTNKIDWLLLTVLHFRESLGHGVLLSALNEEKSFNKIYDMMDVRSKMIMNDNLLAYAASIQEPEIFLYEKV